MESNQIFHNLVKVAVEDAVDEACEVSEFVDMTEFFFFRFSSWQVLPIKQTSPKMAINIRTPAAAAKVVFCLAPNFILFLGTVRFVVAIVADALDSMVKSGRLLATFF